MTIAAEPKTHHAPHVGHLHSLVLTDVIARFSKLRYPDRKVIFTTGTDEHGLKIQQAAAAKGIQEEDFCSGVSQTFRDLAALANISYTDFIRTSERRHHDAVEHFWGRLVAADCVYKGTHSGWYSVSDECFYSASQIKELEDGKKVAVESGNEVVWEEEDNWKFRLPDYRDRLLEWIGREELVYPPAMRTYISAQIETAGELSISRPASRVKWGVPVPGDPQQTIYVWVDALINYITVLGYPKSLIGWPADVHVIGKDIARFHAMYWPALLLAAGLEPPSRILAHAHWTVERSKMSKSRGNVVDPVQAIHQHGLDGIRWNLMRSGGSLPQDSDYSDKQLRDNLLFLSAKLGNLVMRISSRKLMTKINVFDDSMRIEEFDIMLGTMRDQMDQRMNRFEVVQSCELIIDLIFMANRMFTAAKPWQMDDSTGPIIYAYTSLRICGILLQPFIPSKAAELLDRLGVPEDQRGWADAVWSGEIDALEIRTQLQNAVERWEGKGVLFPSSPDATTSTLLDPQTNPTSSERHSG
ncbi:MAG: methionyl-tRNA synthetase [Tremellales sp. Tagirdzhanova-0007]|nr:MAG: methionyl-tRNA synthetase [Tremellales sp. Tagirdzhanova-0007]